MEKGERGEIELSDVRKTNTKDRWWRKKEMAMKTGAHQGNLVGNIAN